MQVVRRMSTLVVWGAVAVSACGDSNGPRGPSSVALLTNTAFVEYDTSAYGAEASELEFTLRGFGIAVAPVIAYDSAALATALAQNSVFIIPEQEVSATFVDSLTPGAKEVLRRFVDSSGGTLIVATHYEFPLIDTLFGHTLASWFGDNHYLLTSGSAGTPFAGGPSLIWDNDGTYPLDPSSLPPGAKIIYQGAGAGVALAVIPQGRGMIVMMGYDWYNAEPHGSQDGGWIEVFRRALRN